MDAPPGDAVGDEVALRDLIVDLVGIAGHAVGHPADEVLERGAVHRRPARHIRNKVSCENLGALVGGAMVVADSPAHERLVRVSWTHMYCHDLVFPSTPSLAPE